MPKRAGKRHQLEHEVRELRDAVTRLTGKLDELIELQLAKDSADRLQQQRSSFGFMPPPSQKDMADLFEKQLNDKLREMVSSAPSLLPNTSGVVYTTPVSPTIKLGGDLGGE